MGWTYLGFCGTGYITAGSLTIRAQKRKTIQLVKSSYGMNIVSSIFSLSAIIINIVDFSVIPCEGHCYNKVDATFTIVSITLVLNLLVFCVTVSIAVFGGRALDHVPANVSANVPPMFVIQNVVSVPPTAYPPNSQGICLSPPPYNAQSAVC
ncbi:membrane-spanning 4-domains subfamily A member 12-like [Dendropsophus ebraccatus]|uniref:membrane-spanning 4-domains subfamily A member 12-like n=1 Tax=Dendropsophus ebraccatus TaxID=150705 RepID=UPI00383154F5